VSEVEGYAGADSPETVLEPEMAIVDAHHHLWDLPGNRYLLDEYLQDVASGHRVLASVYVESRSMIRIDGPEHLRPVGETEFANGVAAMSASGKYGPSRICAAIISYADLSQADDVHQVLDAHQEASPGRFRGIRQGTYWDADPVVWQKGPSMRPEPQLLLHSGFRKGFEILASRDLVFDAVVFHRQIPELTDLAWAYPTATIVLNHMGFPLGVGTYDGHRAEVFAEWRESMVELSACENVWVKLGGGGMPLWGFGFETGAARPGSDELAAAWRPYVETCIDLFGPSRCMFESNYPADRPSAGYVELWNAMKLIVAGASAAEKRALFSGTACEIYKIGGPEGF
jgi:L-fuconolactonase